MAVMRVHMVSPSQEAPYSFEELARIAGVSPALLQRYFDEGLIEAVAGNARTAWFFDDNTLYEVRLIQRLRRELGVNIAGVAVIRQLQRQIEEMRRELERIHDER
jgi:DNA-binding transcriptional MerR regulator